MAANTSLRITTWHDDKASAGFKELTKVTQKLPESFSKASAALGALGGSMQELGGPAAAVTGKLSQMVALVGSGGPLGLGIAALSLAVAAGAHVWSVYGTAQKNVESASRSLAGVFEHQRDVITATADRVRSLEERLRNFGKTASEASVAEAERATARYSTGLTVLQAELAAAEEKQRSLRDEQKAIFDEYNRGNAQAQARMKQLKDEEALHSIQLNGFRQSVRAHEQLIETSKKELEVSKQLLAKDKEVAAAREKKAQEKKDAAADKQDGSAELARIQRIANAEAMLNEHLLRQDQHRAQVQAQMQADQANNAIALAEKIRQANAETTASAIASAQIATSASAAMGQAIGMAMATSIQEAKTLEQTMKAVGISMIEVMLDVAQQMIMAAAAKSAAEAYSSQAGIPVIGPILGVAAAGAAFAFVRAYLSKLKGMEEGGWVTGGTPGKDSVPIMAMPGEYVLSVPMVRQLQGMLGGRPSSGPAFAQGGLVGAGGGGFGNMTVVYQLPPGGLSDAQLERMTRKQAKVLRNMVRNGRAKLGG